MVSRRHDMYTLEDRHTQRILHLCWLLSIEVRQSTILFACVIVSPSSRKRMNQRKFGWLMGSDIVTNHLTWPQMHYLDILPGLHDAIVIKRELSSVLNIQHRLRKLHMMNSSFLVWITYTIASSTLNHAAPRKWRHYIRPVFVRRSKHLSACFELLSLWPE